MSLQSLKGATMAFLTVMPIVTAHTWVEEMYQIDATGAYIGNPGYPIGYQARSASVSDDEHETKILDTSTNPAVCKPLSSGDPSKYPPLSLGAGDYLAMTYQENGHVTQPNLTARPYRGGNVYVYGSLTADSDTIGINDILNTWNVDGTGGNKQGKLIAAHYFDDDQCFQAVPDNAIQEARSNMTAPNKFTKGLDQLPCQTDVQLPLDLPDQGVYTLYWIWDWPRIISDTSNVTEIYSTCAQINLGQPTNDTVKGDHIKFAKTNLWQSAGIPSQVATLIEATALGVGQSSPAPVGPAPTGNNGGDATSNAPEPTSTAAQGSGSGNHVKTITVTGEPETVTDFTTVFAGATPTDAAATGPTNTASHAAATDTATVHPSVAGFLKARGATARVTGSARRSRHAQGLGPIHP